MSAACQYETDVTYAQWDLLYPLGQAHLNLLGCGGDNHDPNQP